jgi:murein DD-endopeptidase MepM/ murein hydrolase activator NlpD
MRGHHLGKGVGGGGVGDRAAENAAGTNFIGRRQAVNGLERETRSTGASHGEFRAYSAVFATVLVLLAGAGLVGVASLGAKPSAKAVTTTSTPPAAARPPAPSPAPIAIVSAPAAPETTATVAERKSNAGGSTPGSAGTENAGGEVVAAASDGADGFAPRLNPRRTSGAPLAEELVATAGPDPRLKPDLAASPKTLEAILSASDKTEASPDSLLTLGQTMLADAEIAPTPFFFADDLPGASAPPPAPMAVAYARDIGDAPRSLSVELAKGENFVDALRRAGVRTEDRNAAAFAFGSLYNLRQLRPGQELRLTTASPAQTIFQIVAEGHEPQSYLLALEFVVDSANRIVLNRNVDNSFVGRKSAVALTTRLATVRGRIDGSLYHSAKRIGAPDKVVADLAAIFAYDVDFQREVFGGDEFEAVFEARYDENGRLVEAGDILYGRMKWKGRQKEKGYYRFASASGGARADYFDFKGESAKRLLMKTPVDGARLSSGFGRRRHPISGYNKQHKGVDFAAPRGTPIKAAGDGVVERADRYGGYGNYVRIRHGQGYKTAYAHLSGFAKGMRGGKRVEQGDVIGYVGSTGASTGPHLHYEVLHENKHVNPQNLKVATGVSLGGKDLTAFKTKRDTLDAMRAASREDDGLLAKDEASSKQL